MTTIPVQYDEIENATHMFITTGATQANHPRMVATLGDSDDNEEYLNDTFGAYED